MHLRTVVYNRSPQAYSFHFGKKQNFENNVFEHFLKINISDVFCQTNAECQFQKLQNSPLHKRFSNQLNLDCNKRSKIFVSVQLDAIGGNRV